ncbi:MAG: TM2 domain-containing membrane protein YozV [Planctomycetota bacterium]|jgi:TM2 domain-containing membrane protein YozV
MTSSAARITVRQNDQSYGPYSLQEVNSMLTSGRLDRDDLAWVEGSPDWTSLRAVPGVLAVPPPPPRASRTSRTQQSSRRASRQDPDYDPNASDRTIVAAFLMAFFIGPFGIHRFYVGKTGSGIAMLLLTLTMVGAIVTVIWATIDWIMIIAGAFTDAEGKHLKRWT